MQNVEKRGKKLEMENNGVRKGAWTPEEDTLLKNCIHMFGEGSWHKVPLRAGLNRCRKSCRLRWLNYLRPNINRGYFTKDEVDLLLRLHKLLGNRWSLIAGRLPGRTANDVKNFWNTHILKKSHSPTRGRKPQNDVVIIKPRPRTFPRTQSAPAIASTTEDGQKLQPCSSDPPPDPFTLTGQDQEVDEFLQWWNNLLEMNDNNCGGGNTFSSSLHAINTTDNNPNINNSHQNGSTWDGDGWGLLGFD